MVALMPLVWVGVMLVVRTYEQRFQRIGADVFRRVFSAAVALLAGVGVFSRTFQLKLAQGLFVALPLAMAVVSLHRYWQRSRVHRLRARGRFLEARSSPDTAPASSRCTIRATATLATATG